MRLSDIMNKEVRQHVQRILSFDEEERYSIWKSQYDNVLQNYKHPLADEIKESLKALNVNICMHKFSLPK